MKSKNEIREDFLIAFVRSLARNIVDSGMLRNEGKYPDIEKIKQNIKIYEKPENTLANVILMNQAPEIQKIMLQPADVKEVYNDKANIASIMEKGRVPENILPIPIPSSLSRKVQTKTQQKMQIPQTVKKTSTMASPLSQPMPFMYQKAAMRILPSGGRSSIVPIKGIPVQASPVMPEKTTLLGLTKIDNILSDPGVQTIECPGPNKPVLVYKGGAVQTAQLNLTNDEINNIMKDISDKTRIPLMSGVFKAAYGNLIITAVMSDFVGTRFMVQKKPQLPQPSSGYQ